MISVDPASEYAKLGAKAPPNEKLQELGMPGSGLPQGSPVPEGVVIRANVGRGQPAPSIAVVPPKIEGGPPAPQISVMPPSGSMRTSLGTLVDVPNVPVSRTTSNPLAVTAEPEPEVEKPAPKPERPPLDLTKEILTHMWELGGPKSKQCQEFYDRSDQALQMWQKNPGHIPLEAVLKFMKRNHGVKEAFLEELEPHFAANGQEGWTQSLPNRGKMDVVVCAPVLGQPTLPFMWTLLYLAKKYELGVNIQSDTMITRSRNRLAQRFLASGARWSLWLDSDIAAPIANADWFRWITGSQVVNDEVCRYDVLNRLLGHGKAAIGGVYASRKRNGQLVIQPEIHPRSHEDKLLCNEIRRGTARGLAAVDWIGFGCALVHREVFLEVQRRFPDLAPKSEFAPWGFFDTEGDVGEDEALSRRICACSVPIWLDVQLVCGHVGNYCFMPEDSAAVAAL